MRKSGNSKLKQTKKIAVCAVFTALTVVLLFLAGIFDVLDLTVVAIASLLVIVAHLEIGSPYDYAVWLAGSALSLILVPSKLPAALYLMFGGLYPILKAYFERMPRLVGWILKILYFNAVLVLTVIVARFVLLLPESDYSLNTVFFLLGNAAFIIYDIAVTCLINLYVFKWRRRLRLDRFFGN